MRTASSAGPPAARIKYFLVVAALVGGVWGCSDSLVDIGRELSLDFSGPPTTALSDSLPVTYDVRGRSLLGMVVDYGDGSLDSLFFSGAQSAGGRVAHKYQEPGDYVVSGKVQDAVEGSIMAEFPVTIVP